MASKRFNVIFKDGNEYETTLYESGGIKIKSEYGGVILELGHYQMMNVVEILDRIRDELKRADRYNNPIETIEEAERMELSESEIRDAMAKTVVDFVDDNLTDWTDDEKLNMKRFLTAFCDDLRMSLADAETAKLDKMAEAER